MERKSLISFSNVKEGIVIKRPSQYVKSPYVADVLISNMEDEENTILCHTPSLGCCGLADKDATVLVIKKDKSKGKEASCTHSIYFSVYKEVDKNSETVVCIYPKLGEELVEICLKNNYFRSLKNIKSYKRETVVKLNDGENIVDSRFDFSGYDKNGRQFFMEIKSVPLANYEDLTEKQKKIVKRTKYIHRPASSKVAYFPDGYRKNKEDTVSPRALKHIQELTYLKKTYDMRCIICFVIQRSDVNRFQASVVDKIYREAFKTAVENGVEVITLVVDWQYNRETEQVDGYFVCDNLPIFLDDE